MKLKQLLTSAIVLCVVAVLSVSLVACGNNNPRVIFENNNVYSINSQAFDVDFQVRSLTLLGEAQELELTALAVDRNLASFMPALLVADEATRPSDATLRDVAPTLAEEFANITEANLRAIHAGRPAILNNLTTPGSTSTLMLNTLPLEVMNSDTTPAVDNSIGSNSLRRVLARWEAARNTENSALTAENNRATWLAQTLTIFPGHPNYVAAASGVTPVTTATRQQIIDANLNAPAGTADNATHANFEANVRLRLLVINQLAAIDATIQGVRDAIAERVTAIDNNVAERNAFSTAYQAVATAVRAANTTANEAQLGTLITTAVDTTIPGYIIGLDEFRNFEFPQFVDFAADTENARVHTRADFLPMIAAYDAFQTTRNAAIATRATEINAFLNREDIANLVFDQRANFANAATNPAFVLEFNEIEKVVDSTIAVRLYDNGEAVITVTDLDTNRTAIVTYTHTFLIVAESFAEMFEVVTRA
jgi:hypothetical protein